MTSFMGMAYGFQKKYWNPYFQHTQISLQANKAPFGRDELAPALFQSIVLTYQHPLQIKRTAAPSVAIFVPVETTSQIS